MIYKTLHKELRMLQHEIRNNLRETSLVSNSFSISGTRRVSVDLRQAEHIRGHLNFFFYFQDPKSEVIKLAKFLEVPYTEEFILDIIEKCKIENLKNNKIDVTRPFTHGGGSTLFRNGVCANFVYIINACFLCMNTQ